MKLVAAVYAGKREEKVKLLGSKLQRVKNEMDECLTPIYTLL
jgi:hypothetical protein